MTRVIIAILVARGPHRRFSELLIGRMRAWALAAQGRALAGRQRCAECP